MKYEYKGVTGKTEIEVDDNWGSALLELDREESNSDHKHSRRYPVAIEDMEYEGEWFSDGSDLLAELVQNETYEWLQRAILGLTSKQQILIERIYFKKEKSVDIAREDGVSKAAIHDRLRKIHDRLKKYLY